LFVETVETLQGPGDVEQQMVALTQQLLNAKSVEAANERRVSELLVRIISFLFLSISSKI